VAHGVSLLHRRPEARDNMRCRELRSPASLGQEPKIAAVWLRFLV
jgi:hypothetical protein